MDDGKADARATGRHTLAGNSGDLFCSPHKGKNIIHLEGWKDAFLGLNHA